MQTAAHPLLGIMVAEQMRPLPFANAALYEKLTAIGKHEGIQVFVFSPNRIDWHRRTAAGYKYVCESKEWVADSFPLSFLIYDRCFFGSKESYRQYRMHVSKLRGLPGIRFLGYGLGSKWEVQRMMQHHAELRPFLPRTFRLAGEKKLRQWLLEGDEVFLKPQGGSQGKGALHVRRTPGRGGSDAYSVNGRDARNAPVHGRFERWEDCAAWLHNQIGGRPYLMQQYLSLRNAEGSAYDVRSFVQKNGKGLWETVGMAARVGKPGSVTSNLHGGGTAEDVHSFLAREFGEAKAAELTGMLTRLSRLIPPALEAAHGRLAELGIDFGIDTQGRIWILEVNSKPGRTIFTLLANEKARFKSLANPIRYARYLLNTHPRAKEISSPALLHTSTRSRAVPGFATSLGG